MMLTTLTAQWRKLSAIVVLFVGLSGQQALAHAHIKSLEPAADTSVATAPEHITLDFSEGIELKFSKISVKDAQNNAVAAGKLALNEHNDTQLILPLPETLPAGLYHVDWKVVSVDGHKTNGNYQFTVK
ncbi:copper homeostasis periplasmic binding protein CopC [Morganella psychrotolerans]|uniref:copper homeostasis periplasmic binding protein CopC n=1 Tax=Morganella psychrotolerans TaxID=368603 RepID=UPI0039B0A01A